jgi:hypothetical protein
MPNMPRTQQSAIKSTGGLDKWKALPLALNNDDWDMIDNSLSPLTTSLLSFPYYSPTTLAIKLPGQMIHKKIQKKIVKLEEDVHYLFFKCLSIISLFLQWCYSCLDGQAAYDLQSLQ